MTTNHHLRLGLALLGAVLAGCKDGSGPDTTPPSVTLTTSPCCVITVIGGAVLLGVIADDNVGVTHVEFYAKAPADPVPALIRDDAIAPFEAPYPGTGGVSAQNGVHQLSAVAYDSAGNAGSSPTVSLLINIDPTVPVVTLTASAPRLTTAGTLTLTTAVSENVVRIELYQDGTEIREVLTPTLPASYSIVLDSTDSGTREFWANAIDAAGNVGTSTLVSVEVDIRWQWVRSIRAQFSHLDALAIDRNTGTLYGAGLTTTGTPGETGVFLTRLDTASNVAWTRTLTAAGQALRARSVAFGNGLVYVGGDLTSPFDSLRAFVAQYDAAGNLVWRRDVDTPDHDAGGYVTADDVGNVYVAGTTNGSVDTAVTPTGADGFLIKFDPNGNRLWTRQFTGTGPGETVTGIAFDPAGAVIVVGQTFGSFGPDTNTVGRDVFVTKFDTAGNQIWARLTRTYIEDHGVTVDPSGAVYLTGVIGVSGTGTNGDVWLTKIDPTGAVQWSTTLTTPETDVGGGVAADATGAYVVGYTWGQFAQAASVLPTDIFLARFTAAGTLVDLRIYGTQQQENGGPVVVDGAGAVYAGGSQGTPSEAIVVKHRP